MKTVPNKTLIFVTFVLLYCFGISHTQSEQSEDSLATIAVAGLEAGSGLVMEVFSCGMNKKLEHNNFDIRIQDSCPDDKCNLLWKQASECALKKCGNRLTYLGSGFHCQIIKEWSLFDRRLPEGHLDLYDLLYPAELVVAIAKSGEIRSVSSGGGEALQKGQQESETKGGSVSGKVSGKISDFGIEAGATASYQKTGTETESAVAEKRHSVQSDNLIFGVSRNKFEGIQDPELPLVQYRAQIDAMQDCNDKKGKKCSVVLLESSEFEVKEWSRGRLLSEAIKEGKENHIQLLVRHGFSPNSPVGDGNRWTPVHEAAHNGRLDFLVKLAEGFHPNPDDYRVISDNFGNTALHVAVMELPLAAKRDTMHKVIKLLLKNDFDSTVENGAGMTALHVAVQQTAPPKAVQILADELIAKLQKKDKIALVDYLAQALEMSLGVHERIHLRYDSFKRIWGADAYIREYVFTLEEFETQQREVVDILSHRLNKLDQQRKDQVSNRFNNATDPLGPWPSSTACKNISTSNPRIINVNWNNWDTRDCGPSLVRYFPIGGNYGFSVVPGR